MKRTRLQQQAQLRRVAQLKRGARIRKVATSRGGASRSLIAQLDEMARALCMARAGAYRIEGSRAWVGTCRKCQLLNPLQWAHFNSRRLHSIRWDRDNSMALCGGCHYNFAHHKPGEFRDWWRSQIGENAFNLLALRLKATSRPDYAGLRVALRQEWLALTGAEFQ